MYRNPDNIIFTITKSSGDRPDGFSPQNPVQMQFTEPLKYREILFPKVRKGERPEGHPIGPS